MNRGFKTIIVLSLLIFSLGCIDKTSTDTNVPGQKDELKGQINLDGSTTVYPVAIHAAKVFMQDHPGVIIDVRQSSTGEGLERFLNGEIDIADATRPPKESEYQTAKNKGVTLHMTHIGYDGIGVIVHTTNPVSNLSISQLKAIYFDGNITDWSQLTNGAKKGRINIYNTDPKTTGAAELFNKIITGHDTTPYVSGTTMIHPTPQMVPTIINDPDGIAFTPIKWVNSSVKLLTIDGVTASRDNIVAATYPFARKMLMITNGPPKDLTLNYINFIMSKDGQNIVSEEGFIPVS